MKFSSSPTASEERVIQREAARLCEHFNERWSHHLNQDDVAALIESDRLHDLTHTFTAGKGWKKKIPAYTPTPEEVNEWSLEGLGHDAINCWVVVKAECKRLGLGTKCIHCHGNCSIWPSEKIKRQHSRWKPTEPPKGNGYQLWETVSEGSPISPVFTEPEALAEWLANSPDYSWKKNDAGTTKAQWLKFIMGPGWAPTMISNSSGLVTGVQAVAA